MVLKRTLVLMMMLALVFAAAGCGGPDAESTDPAMTEPVDTEPAPPPVEQPMESDDSMGEDMGAPMLNDCFFAFDQYNLTAESKGILEANADELRRVADSNITIEGHCDERGTKSYNLALGEKRANAAKDYLVALGISASRINTVSMGKEKPFAFGSNEAAWAKNRRAHFIVR